MAAGRVRSRSAASTPCATTVPSERSSSSTARHAGPYTLRSDASDSWEVATREAPPSARASASEKEKSPSPTVRMRCPRRYRPTSSSRPVRGRGRATRGHVSGRALGTPRSPALVRILARHTMHSARAQRRVSRIMKSGAPRDCWLPLLARFGGGAAPLDGSATDARRLVWLPLMTPTLTTRRPTTWIARSPEAVRKSHAI